MQAWRKYDTDRSGYIESNELKVTLQAVSKASLLYFFSFEHVLWHILTADLKKQKNLNMNYGNSF